MNEFIINKGTSSSSSSSLQGLLKITGGNGCDFEH